VTQPITIKDVQTIMTQPAGSRLIVVKVITSEPGLYGLGCATFTQRFHAVHAAIEKHLKPFLIGRDVSRIEEIWQMSMVHGYWRNGPVLNNAISGVDMALWDIKGKQAGMPAYQLLGGKCREAAAVYVHADGRDPREVEDNVRQQCSTPLAMGELFNNPREWQPLIAERLIDFVRMHVSQMGGITPARNVAVFANMYGVRTAWHGPGDVSPVGHAANLHLDLWAPNFGVQEWCRFPELMYEMFPGTPEVRNGYMVPNDRPGLGVDVDEGLAARYPCQDEVEWWTQTRLPDGSPARP
jgi:L-alanine-DL-glutamate epimerase-like enolase superfamily enzyme